MAKEKKLDRGTDLPPVFNYLETTDDDGNVSKTVSMSPEQLEEALDNAAKTASEKAIKDIRDEFDSTPKTVAEAISAYSKINDKKKEAHSFGKLLQSVVMGKGDMEKASYFADKELGEEVLSKSLVTNVGPSGGALVLDDLMAEITPALRETSTLRALGVPVLPMPNGNISMPRFNPGAAAAYVGEAARAPISQPTTDQVTWSSKRLQILIPVSRQLLRTNHINVAAAVQRDAIAALGAAEDASFIRGDAANLVSPTGIFELAKGRNQSSASLGSSPNEMERDLAESISQLAEANVIVKGGAFIFNPRTYYVGLSTARIEGIPVFPEINSTMAEMKMVKGMRAEATNSIPNNLGAGTETEFGYIQPQDVLIGEFNNMEVMLSEEGSYVDAGGTTISAVQHDLAILKLVVDHDINTRYDQSVTVRTGVGY